MFGAVLRLIAAGEAGRRLGVYLRNLTAKYLMLSAAGIVFAGAVLFALLAGFWALDLWTGNQVWASLIMAGSLFLAGFLITLAAYRNTKGKPETGKQAAGPQLLAAQSSLPPVEEVGRQIEEAARRYGPVGVVAAAAAGGLVAGLLVKRFTQARAYEASRARRPRRRYS
jgi:hypothetical protein